MLAEPGRLDDDHPSRIDLEAKVYAESSARLK